MDKPKRRPGRPLKGATARTVRLDGKVEPWVMEAIDGQPGSRMDTVTRWADEHRQRNASPDPQPTEDA